MSLFNIYKIIINCKDEGDYWDDVTLNNASSVLANFQEEDWIALLKEWNMQSSLWQESCAETLSKVEIEYSVKLLCEMLNSDNENLATIAADSLSHFSTTYLKSTLNLEQFAQINLLAQRNDMIGISLAQIVKEISASK
jgi:predicted HicB family RNase H-like nuclease